MTIGTWLETCNNHNTKFQSKATTLLINLLIRLAPVLTSCKQAHLFTYSLIVFPWLGRCWLWHPLLLLKSKTFSPFVSCLACLGMSWKIHYFLLSIMLLLLLAHRHRHLSLSRSYKLNFWWRFLFLDQSFRVGPLPYGAVHFFKGSSFNKIENNNWGLIWPTTYLLGSIDQHILAPDCNPPPPFIPNFLAKVQGRFKTCLEPVVTSCYDQKTLCWISTCCWLRWGSKGLGSPYKSLWGGSGGFKTISSGRQWPIL